MVKCQYSAKWEADEGEEIEFTHCVEPGTYQIQLRDDRRRLCRTHLRKTLNDWIAHDEPVKISLTRPRGKNK